MNPYVHTWKDDDLTVVGPFLSVEAATTYGRQWQAENEDDPRWQVLYFSSEPKLLVKAAP